MGDGKPSIAFRLVSHDEKKPCVIGKETLGKISIEYSFFYYEEINAYIIPLFNRRIFLSLLLPFGRLASGNFF